MSAFLPLCKKGLNEPVYFFRFPSSERYFTQKQLLVGYILSDTLTLLLHDDIVYRIAKCKVRVKKFNICIALYHFNIIYLLFQSQVNVMKLPMASKCIEVSEGYLGPYQASDGVLFAKNYKLFSPKLSSQIFNICLIMPLEFSYTQV